MSVHTPDQPGQRPSLGGRRSHVMIGVLYPSNPKSGAAAGKVAKAPFRGEGRALPGLVARAMWRSASAATPLRIRSEA